MNTTKKFIEQLRSYICGARSGAYYSADTTNEEEDTIATYKRGYQEGLLAGYEGALGLLEVVEQQLDYGILDIED